MSKLRLTREARNMTRADVVKQVNADFTEGTLRNWEACVSEPKASQLAALAELYGVPMEALIGKTAELGSAV